MKHISELSLEALFFPPSQTRAEVCTQGFPILDKWPHYKLRDNNLSFPLCFKGKGWWPLHHAQTFHAQRTLPRNHIFSEKKGVAIHLSMETWSFPHRLKREAEPPPPFEDRGASPKQMCRRKQNFNDKI